MCFKLNLLLYVPDGFLFSPLLFYSKILFFVSSSIVFLDLLFKFHDYSQYTVVFEELFPLHSILKERCVYIFICTCCNTAEPNDIVMMLS